jgi:hypothetical protein
MLVKIKQEIDGFQRDMTGLGLEIVLGVMVRTSNETQEDRLACCNAVTPLANVPILSPHMLVKIK